MLRALRCIPLDHQILVEPFYWEGLTGPDLATVLEVPEGTVRTRLRRARALLAEKIEELADSPNLEDWARHIVSLIPARG